MIESEALQIIGSYGFPIFITCWFMFRTEKVIGRNTEAFEKLWRPATVRATAYPPDNAPDEGESDANLDKMSTATTPSSGTLFKTASLL